MHFSVNKEHRDFYKKNHWIEAEELLKPSHLEALQRDVHAVLANRLRHKTVTPEKQFEAGHDLWRDHGEIRKILLGKEIATVASEIIEQRPLRFGRDFLLPASGHPFSSNQHTLRDLTCIQGVLCGALICIQGPTTPLEEAAQEMFPTEPGHIVFFDPDFPIPFDQLLKRKGAMYVVIVYIQRNAVYTYEERDPHAHGFKKIGYALGDKLTDVLHPMVYP